MTLRELGNSIVQLIKDVIYHFYDTLVRVKKVDIFDLEIKEILTIILIFSIIMGSINYLYENTIEPYIEKICHKRGYNYYQHNGYVVLTIVFLTISIMIYLINFLIPSYQ